MTRIRTLSEFESKYFDWLYQHVGALSDRNPSHSYFVLLETLHNREFTWSVPNDDNRIGDGAYLRERFCDFVSDGYDFSGPQDSCSVLEMLLALAERLEFKAAYTNLGYSEGDWFWSLLENLGITHYTDEAYSVGDWVVQDVEVVMDTLVHRQYGRDGRGGLFPLKRAKKDQRKVEIWYQMSAYLMENGILDEPTDLA